MMSGKLLVEILVASLGLLMIAAGVLAVRAKSLLAAILLSGGVSLGASVVFLAVGAPDVAMTEAAIGSGLTTLVFLYAMARMKAPDHEDGGGS